MVDSRLSLIDHSISDDPRLVLIEQFAQDVLDFSSQYGSDISISYTAYNITGKPSKFPDYGDFPQAFVMRTYGRWWTEAPSRPEVFMPQNYGPIVSQDYIDLKFEQAVCPCRVNIYETYNPGSVVRIWARLEYGQWVMLWEGEPQSPGHNSRIFSPRLKRIKESTCLIRLEFDHSRLEYYTELDAVMMVGTRPPNQCDAKLNIKVPFSQYRTTSSSRAIPCSLLLSSVSQPTTAEILAAETLAIAESSAIAMADASALQLSVPISSDLTERIMELNIHAVPIKDDRPVIVRMIKSEKRDPSPDNVTVKCISEIDRAQSGLFSCLPDETVLYIFKFLDIVSLLECAKVNKHFHSIAQDSLLYTELNLKPYWPRMNSRSLETLSSRCKRLIKLDLSWCGNYWKIEGTTFIKFVKECGSQLIILRLDCCKFVGDDCIKEIVNSCRHLKELTLKNCSRIKKGFEHLAELDTLERLDLYRTSIETGALVNILKASPNLKHINLGSCVRVSSMDEVAHALGTYNRELRTVDFWKTYSLTPVGVRALSECRKLEEVDFGWCLGVSIPGDCLKELAMGCPKLKKLFLAALRGIMDRDLAPFVELCPCLEQLDLLGVRSITADICLRFLNNCKNLRLLDLSFCEQIQESEVLCWRKQFPAVSIKRSFQYDGSSGCYLPNHY